MAETEVSSAPTPKKTKAATPKPKKAKTAPSHPKVSEMVNTAISTLKERGGSSVQAIKKYVGAHYKVDVDKLAPFIKKYLKNAVATGALVQTKGKGASGSFRMTTQPKEKASKPKAAAPKPKKAVAKPAATKRTAKPKTVKKAPAAAKKPKLAKSPKKAKAVKAKAPKPKKTKATPKKGPAKKSRK